MPVGPVPVRGGAFGEGAGVPLDEPLGQVRGVEQVLGEQVVLVVHQVVALRVQDLHDALGVLGLPLPCALGALLRRPGTAQHVDQLVEQRHVRHRPGVTLRAVERLVGTGRAQPLARAVQRRQQSLGRQHRPQLVERGVEGVVGVQLVEHLRLQLRPGLLVLPGQPAPADAGDGALGEHVGDDLDEGRAGLVVRQAGVARLLPGPLRGLGVDADRDVLQLDLQRLLRQPLPVGDRRREHVQDPQRALGLRGLRRVLRGDVQAGHEVAGGHEHHVGLAQRRQDPADVVEERGVGANHEHTVAFHAFPLGVEQVGDAVQCHHGLPRARAALDDHHARVVEPDDLVLLGLDGGHDVAHALPARGVDRRQQGRVAVRVLAGPAEDLVGEAGDRTPAGVEVPAPTHVLGVGAGGGVERAGGGRPPVDQQRRVVVVLVEDPDPADVGAFSGGAVQPAEAQPVVRHVQSRGLPRQRAHRDVPLHGGPAVVAQRGAVLLHHPRALGVEPRVEPRDVFPLGPQLLCVLLN